MSTILDFQIQPISAESYSLAVCERGSSQTLATATFSHRVDFLTDFSVDRLNASAKDAAERFAACCLKTRTGKSCPPPLPK